MCADLKISIRIPFSLYGTKMLDNSSLKVSALVHDKQHPGDGYLAVKNIIPQEPTITIQVGPQRCLGRGTPRVWTYFCMQPLRLRWHVTRKFHTL